ncbi:MAG: hypothetical protein ACYCWE_14735 [Eubacteriales bacterium]
MKFSKTLALLLVLSMLVFVLPACGNDADGDAETTAATDETTIASDETTAVPETTAAPETTEAVTEAPKVYEYTDVKVIDFSTMADGDAVPFTVNAIDDIRIEGGLLKGTSNGGDPNFTYNGGDLSFPADSVQIIEIKYMNLSANYDMQLFFTTDTITGFAENASFKEYLNFSADDGDTNDWNVIQIDTSTCTDWVGTITNFRLDPFSAEGGFEVAYIKFLTMTEVTA